MTKAEIVKRISKEAYLPYFEAEEAYESVIDTIKRHLTESDDPITLRGLGTFFTRQRKSREGRNPKTGVPAEITKKRMVKFKPSNAIISS